MAKLKTFTVEIKRTLTFVQRAYVDIKASDEEQAWEIAEYETAPNHEWPAVRPEAGSFDQLEVCDVEAFD